MPSASLATPTRVRTLVIGFALAGSLVVGGCGSQRKATGFCATIEQGRAAFDSTDEAHVSASLAEFDRVSAGAPAAIAPDLETVSAFLRLLIHDPKAAATTAELTRYAAATGRIDRYLHDACGIEVPPQGKFL